MTVKAIWDYLESSYGKPGISLIYMLFKKVLVLSVPDNKDLTVALDEMAAIYDCLAGNKVDIAEHLKAMILIVKLPPSVESSVLLATADKGITDLKVQDLCNVIMMHWDQKSNRKQGSSSGGNAKKLSAIKCK